jgi:hypothetical protein
MLPAQVGYVYATIPCSLRITVPNIPNFTDTGRKPSVEVSLLPRNANYKLSTDLHSFRDARDNIYAVCVLIIGYTCTYEHYVLQGVPRTNVIPLVSVYHELVLTALWLEWLNFQPVHVELNHDRPAPRCVINAEVLAVVGTRRERDLYPPMR